MSSSKCNSANSLFGGKKSSKMIKFTSSPRGTALSVVDGANTLAKMDLCDWSKNFNQYNQTSLYLESGALNREIHYGGLGTQVTFLAIKVEYVKKKSTTSCSSCVCEPTTTQRSENVFNTGYNQPINPIPTNCSCGSNPSYAEQQTQFVPKSSCGCGTGCSSCTKPDDTPYLSYIFETNTQEVRYIDDLMILTGTNSHKIPKIFLSNPNKDFDAIVTIIASTESITFDEIIVTPIGDDTITVENLEYTDLTSTPDQLRVNSSAGTVLFMRWQDITTNSPDGDFEVNGRIITVDDYVQGTINLSFIDEYNAKQAFSLMKWALCDTVANIITGVQAPDLTAPVIDYSERFSTEIVLAEFPPVDAGTCGINGTSACQPNYIAGTQGIILKEDLFAFQVDGATDDRDCNVDFTYDNLTLQKVGSTTTVDAITDLGKYHMTFEVSDHACNLQTDSFILNVKDTEPPQLIVTDLGFELFESYSTSGTSAVPPPVDINVNSFVSLDSNFDSLDFSFNSSTCGEVAYIIFNQYPVVVEITSQINGTTGLCDFVFDEEGVGNGPLIWHPTAEIGVTKEWIYNTDIYDITFQGLGSFLFNLSETDKGFLVDEDGNFIVDEFGNRIIIT